MENDFLVEGQQNVKFYVSKLDKYINEVMKQLSFNMRSITEAVHGDNLKYKTEVLKSEDVDFDFVLRSLKEGNILESIPSVMNIFKISPKIENDSAKLNGEYILYSGVKSNNVLSILSDGYTKSKNSKLFNLYVNSYVHKTVIYKATLNLEEEISKGSSYYAVDGKVKKLSFVFLSTVGDVSEDSFPDAEDLKDSRGSFFDVNLATSIKPMKRCKNPAYLIVFELNEQYCK